MRVNLNADIGEGFGAYTIGDDASMLRLVNSVSIACGFHGGDAGVMRRVVRLAREHGVSIGAHPAFNDLWGFGRRAIEMEPDEIEPMIAYQIGALQAIAAYAGLSVTHVKPHGALYNMAAVRPDYARAIGRAIKVVDPALIYVAPGGSAMAAAGAELGLRVAEEAFVDRTYEPDGTLTPRRLSGAVIADPAAAAARAVRMVREQAVLTREGAALARRIDTLCVHGDSPHGVAVARATRDALVAAGIRLLPLPDLLR